MATGARDVPMLQACVKDPNLPVDLRLGFVKKVYGILTSMLILSFGIASPFVLMRDDSVKFMNHNLWILGIVAALLALHQFVNLAMCFEACCGGGECRRAYLKMFVKVPLNYIFLYTYAVCTGVMVGLICAEYKAESVILAFLLTAGIMVILTAYAVFTKNDFSGCGLYVMAILAGMLFLSILSIFVRNHFVYMLLAVGSAVLMSFVIIYDTQLIFGSISLNLNRSMVRQVEFTVDMYAFAAYQLYLDFINMFLYLLEIFGQRRN